MGKASSKLELTLLTPHGNVTQINQKHFRELDEHLSPGDRVAWQRHYLVIHEAIVLKVNAETSEIWVFERTKKNEDGAPYASGIATITKIELYTQSGQLYRYNDDIPDSDSLSPMLKRILKNLDTRGYNLFSQNCQQLASDVKNNGDGGSYQTSWLFTQMIEAMGIPALSELLEGCGGGADVIGIISAGVLHALAFVVELIAALSKLSNGHMSKGDCVTVITRQLLMHVVGWFGNYLSSLLRAGGANIVIVRVLVIIVLGLFCAMAADALLLYAGMDPDSNFRYLVMAAGACFGLSCGVVATGGWLEFLISMILGFVGKFGGHTLHHAGSWLLEWLTSKKVNGEYLTRPSELRRADHITTNEWVFHPHCHAIFKEWDGNKMKIIRNTYKSGVIKDVVQFNSWVYRYNYLPSEVRSDDDVIRIAESKLGNNEYSWYNYNCKTFAEQCKLTHVSNDNTIDWEEHFNEIMQDPNISKDEKNMLKEQFRQFQSSLSEQSHNQEETIEADFLTEPLSEQSHNQEENIEAVSSTTSKGFSKGKTNSRVSGGSRGKRRSRIMAAMRSLVCIS